MTDYYQFITYRSIYEIQQIFLPMIFPHKWGGLSFHGDTTFSLHLQLIQHLLILLVSRYSAWEGVKCFNVGSYSFGIKTTWIHYIYLWLLVAGVFNIAWVTEQYKKINSLQYQLLFSISYIHRAWVHNKYNDSLEILIFASSNLYL